MTGETHSDETTFPVLIGPDLTFNRDYDAFVAKVKPDGTSLVYCGYIGGNDEDWGDGIAVDSQGWRYCQMLCMKKFHAATLMPSVNFTPSINSPRRWLPLSLLHFFSAP